MYIFTFLTCSNNDYFLILFSNYAKIVSSQIGDLKKFITDKIDGVKRSIQYDLAKKIEALQVEIVQRTQAQSSNKSADPWSIIKNALPIETTEVFIQFDNEIKEDAEKQTALVRFLSLFCFFTFVFIMK